MSEYMIFIKFTETIQNVLKIHVAFNTQPRLELSICTCKAKGHLSANFTQSKYVMVMLHFCQYHANPTIENYISKNTSWASYWHVERKSF